MKRIFAVMLMVGCAGESDVDTLPTGAYALTWTAENADCGPSPYHTLIVEADRNWLDGHPTTFVGVAHDGTGFVLGPALRPDVRVHSDPLAWDGDTLTGRVAVYAPDNKPCWYTLTATH